MSNAVKVTDVTSEKSLLDCFMEVINGFLKKKEKEAINGQGFCIRILQDELFEEVRDRTDISFDSYTYREMIPELEQHYEAVGWEFDTWKDWSGVCNYGTELQFYGKMPESEVQPVGSADVI